MATEEVVVPFGSSKNQLASELRSTLLTTSLRTLREHGYYEQYLAFLPKQYHEAMVTIVAGVWMPIDIGIAHYRACDKLNLTPKQAFEIGNEVGDRIQGTILGLMVRTAKTSGLTPWTGLGNCKLFYERCFIGGAVSLIKLGPKEARLDVVNNPLAPLLYFRHGLRGIACAGAQLFCQKAYAHDMPRLATETTLSIRISWA